MAGGRVLRKNSSFAKILAMGFKVPFIVRRKKGGAPRHGPFSAGNRHRLLVWHGPRRRCEIVAARTALGGVV